MKSKKLLVYERLKEKIINQEIKPGGLINDVSLSRELEVSKTPIREAIQQLEKEGFIENIPGKGAFASRISIQDVRETFEIREMLECETIKRAAIKHDPNKLFALRRSFESREDSSSDGEPSHFRSGDHIHAFIFESVGNQRLMEIYQRLLDHIVRHRIHFFSDDHQGRSEESYREHVEILNALADQDPVRSEQAMRAHLRNSWEYVKSII
jgi:GntR family transcriptional regulator, rspAB operon transcriptional repressor